MAETMSQDFGPAAQLIDMIRPMLHHPTPFGPILTAGICSPYGVAVCMSQLALDRIRISDSHFVE